MARTRMPVLLDRADIKSWLTGAPAMELLKPAAAMMRPRSRKLPRD
jgi:putative SOS response-associated peptidase YedK